MTDGPQARSAARPSERRATDGEPNAGDSGGPLAPERMRPAWGDVGLGRAWVWAGVLLAVALVPFCFMGPGTDLDVRAILGSGRAIVEDGTYTVSRTPGAPVHEAAVGVLYEIAGTTGSNLGSLVAAVAVVIGLAVLLRNEGATRVGLSLAVVVANPWFLIAATSTIDFLWALAFWVGAAVVLRSRSTLPGAAIAGVLAGLAIGSRASTAFLVAGLALAELLERPGDTSGERRAPWVHPRARVLMFAAVAALSGLLLFVPAFLSSGESLAFVQNDVPASTFLVQAGRYLAKNLYFFGPFAAVVLVLAVPALGRVLTRWRTDWLVRLGSLTVLISQVLFLRYPWKMGHLLPTLVGLALLLARALPARPRLLASVAAAQALYALVSISLLAPDTPNRATGGRFVFEPRWGAFVVDTQCRLDDPDAWKGPGEGEYVLLHDKAFDEVARQKLQVVWDCAKPWAR